MLFNLEKYLYGDSGVWSPYPRGTPVKELQLAYFWSDFEKIVITLFSLRGLLSECSLWILLHIDNENSVLWRPTLL